ncbi:MAG: Phosphoglycerol transferase MdoB, partial [Pedobacter sp.]|nr:Phosphoglycerol transferase MdoB [Pedobacter sp.]
FAFFNWDQGFGFVTSEQTITYDAVGNNVLSREKKETTKIDEQVLNSGKAFMQRVYQEYIEY